MLIVRWGYMPPEVRRAFAPLLYQHLWLVPGWCRQLFLQYDPHGDPNADASSSSEPEYRQGRITLHAGWLDANPTQRRLEVIHEILHLPMSPMVEEHAEAVDRLFVDGDAPKYRETLQEQWRKAFEGTVQDLSFAILALDSATMPTVPFVEEEDEHPPLKAAG